mgnify:FL=1
MAMADATVKKILIPLTGAFVLTGTPTKDGRKYALVIGLGATTDDDGDFTPASYLPDGWDTLEWISYEVRTLGAAGTVAPLVAVTTFAAEFVGNAATTINYLMVVSKSI